MSTCPQGVPEKMRFTSFDPKMPCPRGQNTSPAMPQPNSGAPAIHSMCFSA